MERLRWSHAPQGDPSWSGPSALEHTSFCHSTLPPRAHPCARFLPSPSRWDQPLAPPTDGAGSNEWHYKPHTLHFSRLCAAPAASSSPSQGSPSPRTASVFLNPWPLQIWLLALISFPPHPPTTLCKLLPQGTVPHTFLPPTPALTPPAHPLQRMTSAPQPLHPLVLPSKSQLKTPPP